MSIPNLSNSMSVARLRHIQSIHERSDRRNPDTLVRYFIPMMQRLRSATIGRAELTRLRANPFYYYLIARTKYYDQIVSEAVDAGVRSIISVGCGSDTRPYRFKHLLCSRGVKVLECDQAETIIAKQRLIKRRGSFDHVDYLPIDLNDGAWPELQKWLTERRSAKVLVLMEGVSPYVNEDAFCKFLELLSSLPADSQVAYDFKIRGIEDSFGREGRTQKPFRLPLNGAEVADFHVKQGLQVEAVELSSDLCKRLIPDLNELTTRLFREDGLVRLRVPMAYCRNQ